MKKKVKLILIIFNILIMYILSSCINENGEKAMEYNELSNLDQPLSSPSGNYKAIIEKFNDNDVKSYKLFIEDVNDKEPKYETDLIFRARDKNFVFWADEEDILWGYSGDIGIFFWVNENNSWVKKTYTKNSDAIVPQALKDARPNIFKK